MRAAAEVDGAADQEQQAQSPRGTGRRRFLAALGVTVLGAGAVGGAMVEDVLPGGPRLRRALGLTGPDGTVPAVPAGAVRTATVRSDARGRDVRVVVYEPPGAAADLPVCLALHGRGEGAEYFTALGTPQFLAAAVAAGVPPFRVVAVDGGPDSYWHARTPDDDPMAMLTAELPHWLAARGLPEPSRVLGISMGASGALQYARARHGRLAAAALLSPALFRGWADARAVGAYRDEADWREHEPLLHLDDVAEVGRISAWCGTEDPFCPAARGLTAGHGVQARFPRGQHDVGFWRRVMPDAMVAVGAR